MRELITRLFTSGSDSMLRKLTQIILLLVFWSGLAFVGVQTWRSPCLATTENRVLAQKPQLPESWKDIPDYVRGLEAWWNDGVTYRPYFIRYFNLIRMRVGVSPQNDVLLGKNGWFFSGGVALDDFRNRKPFTSDEIESWKRYLVFRHEDAKRRGMKFIFVIVPNKESVYAEYMPDNVVRLSEKSRTDQIIDSVNNDGVSVLDLRKILDEGKKHSRVYHQTDTHWNLIGANYGQYAINQALAPDFPQLKPALYSANDFEFVDGWYVNQAGIVYYSGLAYMMAIGDLTNEREPIFKVARAKCAKPAEVPLTPDWQNIPEAQRLRTFHATECEAGHYRVVAFRDSFTELLEPYLSETYRYIAYLWLPRPIDLYAWNYFLDNAKPDIVIDETVERFLGIIPRAGIDYPDEAFSSE
jgi:alginate O-acetyltransferase complex protein AlgJ